MSDQLGESSSESKLLEDGNYSYSGSAQQISKAEALSLTFMKSLSGLFCDCDNCDNDRFKSIGKDKPIDGEKPESNREDDADNSIGIGRGEEILGNTTAISPLVLGPMMAENLDSRQPGIIETVIGECTYYLFFKCIRGQFSVKLAFNYYIFHPNYVCLLLFRHVLLHILQGSLQFWNSHCNTILFAVPASYWSVS